MFLSRNKKIMYTPVKPSFTIYKWGLSWSKLYRYVFVLLGLCQVKSFFEYVHSSDSSHACAKSHPGIRFPLMHSIMSNDSFSDSQGPIRLRGCAGCLGLQCPHMLKDTFSNGAAHLITESIPNGAIQYFFVISLFCKLN